MLISIRPFAPLGDTAGPGAGCRDHAPPSVILAQLLAETKVCISSETPQSSDLREARYVTAAPLEPDGNIGTNAAG